MSKKLWIGVAAGMAGGLAASFVMDEFQALIKKMEPAPKAPAPANGEDPATVKAASALAAPVLRRRLTEDEKKIAGPAMHYAMGAVSGGIYGAFAEAYPWSAAGFGSLFGAILWVIADEVAVPGFGLSEAPNKYPPAVHANALASHVVFGISTDIVRRIIEDEFSCRRLSAAAEQL